MAIKLSFSNMWIPICQNKYLHLYDVLQSPWHYAHITVIFYLLVLHNRVIKLLDMLKYKIFCSLCRKSGWESVSGESHLSALLRGRVFLALATFGHDKTHKEALRRFQTLLNDRNTPLLSADTRRVLLLPVYLNHLLIYRGLFKVDM